jgi:hypothetical protein
MEPYLGHLPYAFISYSHHDRAEVVRDINNLHELGCRIWYNQGIESGRNIIPGNTGDV